MQMMLMMLIRWVQVRAGACANDAQDARPFGATEGWGWCK